MITFYEQSGILFGLAFTVSMHSKEARRASPHTSTRGTKLRSTIYKRDLYLHGLANKCPEKLTVNFLQVDIQLIRTRDKVFLKFYTLCHQNTIDITLPIDTYFITAFYTDQPDK